MTFKENLPRYIFLILIIALIFFLNLKPPLDPDLGWHLRAGQDLLRTKTIPRLDPYSYTMFDWNRVWHDWLSNGIIYFIAVKWGLFVLAVVFTLITIAAFLLISRLIKTKIEYSLIAVLLGSLGSLPITGIRVQMFSLLALSWLLFILFRFRQNQKKKTIYFLPFLFFVWVNLHAGFSIGLLVFTLFLFFEGIKIITVWLKKKYQSRKPFNPVSLRGVPHFYKSAGRQSNPVSHSITAGLLRSNFVLPRNDKSAQGFFCKVLPVIWSNKFFKKLFSKNELIKESLTKQSWLKLVYLSLFCFAMTFISPYGYRIYSLIIAVAQDSYGRARIGEWQPFQIRSPVGWEFLMYLALLAILALIYFKKIDLTLLGSSAVLTYLAFSSWRNMPLLIIMTIPVWVYIVKSAADPVLLRLLKNKFILSLLLIVTVIIGYQQVSWVWAISHNGEVLAQTGKYPQKAVQFIKANPEKFQGNMFNEYNWGGYLIWQLPEHKVFIDGRMPHLKIGDRHIFKDFNDLQALINPEEIIAKYNIDWFLLYKDRLVSFYLPNEGFKEIYQDDLAVILKKE